MHNVKNYALREGFGVKIHPGALTLVANLWGQRCIYDFCRVKKNQIQQLNC